MLTFGFLGIGWFIDLFLLGGYVDTYNALHLAKYGVKNNNINNISINIPATAERKSSVPAEEPDKDKA